MYYTYVLRTSYGVITIVLEKNYNVLQLHYATYVHYITFFDLYGKTTYVHKKEIVRALQILNLVESC